MLRSTFLILVAISCLVFLLPIPAQEKKQDIPAIENAIKAKDYLKADSLLRNDVAMFLSKGNLDTLVYYIPLAGKIANGQSGAAAATKAVLNHIDLLKSGNAGPALLLKSYRIAAGFFEDIGQMKSAYEASEQALKYAELLPGNNAQEVASCEYSLGAYAHRLANISLSELHHRRSFAIREADKNTSFEDTYLSANAMGALMWFSSKYDSAAIFYNKALEALSKAKQTDINKYFRPANVYNNLAALYSAEGKTTEGMRAMEKTIDNLQKFIASKDPDPKKQSATEGLFEAIDNLAGIYREVGAYGKAGELLEYSYHQKRQKLDSNNPGIFISEILLGQHYNDVREHDLAINYLQRGLKKLEKADGDYLFWAADAYYALALIYENTKQPDKAAIAYAKSEELFGQSYGEDYDNIYMDFLRNASLFYASNNDYSRAFADADKVYKYLISVGEGNSLQGFYQLLNIAEINYLTKGYKQAIAYCDNALNTVNAKMKDGLTLLDSVKIEVFKPRAMLIRAKSEYELHQNKDTTFLKELSARLKDALAILEKRKVLIDDDASINILIADHQELIDFAKKIELQLYQYTGKEEHLDQFINLHESALYSRIRSRLDKQQAVQFSHLPDSVQQEERKLKMTIASSLRTDKPNSELMKDYVRAINDWQTHLDKVKKEYPAYFNMRYATIFRSLPELQSSLPDSSALIRYFFTDTSLVALVVDKNIKTIVRLNNKGLEEKVNQLLLNPTNGDVQLPILYDLYQMLWQPVASFVHNKRVMIIPDGALYNLSFDMLATKPLTSYDELVSNCLLANYTFSYHYSLFMLGQPALRDEMKANYVAFAPGFSDRVKEKYVAVVEDSLDIDYSYLKLLPQPNTNKLAKKIKGMIGGDIFLDENSTQVSFKKNAGKHRIIHIGTHAAFNNVHPEQSGLIFAKNTSGTTDSNFLSLYDIYNCDMQSDITLLTACESGRPGYRDGEGMVSLAHAFNYAGSKSILTALWKIDEQSSSRITELFIENLKKGLLTDEALRNAKLSYLQQSEGRTLAPAYWAGLVMMGEPTQLSLSSSANYAFWIIGGILAIALLVFFFVRSKKKH